MFKELDQYRFGLAGEGQADIIQSYLTSHRGRVLYVGCGIGAEKFQNLVNLSKQVIGVDKELNIVRPLEKEVFYLAKVKFLVADARRLPFEPLSFDHILALGLFAHISPAEVPSVFSEFWRVCRFGGYVMVTNDPGRSPRATYIEAGKQCGFELRKDDEGYCPHALITKRRYLLVFAKNRERLEREATDGRSIVAGTGPERDGQIHCTE